MLKSTELRGVATQDRAGVVRLLQPQRPVLSGDQIGGGRREYAEWGADGGAAQPADQYRLLGRAH